MCCHATTDYVGRENENAGMFGKLREQAMPARGPWGLAAVKYAEIVRPFTV